MLPRDSTSCDFPEKAAVVGNKVQELVIHDLKAVGVGLNKVLHNHLRKGVSLLKEAFKREV